MFVDLATHFSITHGSKKFQDRLKRNMLKN
jgi:hypothetical protein